MLYGPVSSNGSYEWDFNQVLSLQVPLPVWSTNPKQTSLMTPWLSTNGRVITTPSLILEGSRIASKKESSRYGIGFHQPNTIQPLISSHQQTSLPTSSTVDTSCLAYTSYEIPYCHAYADTDHDTSTPTRDMPSGESLYKGPWATAYSKKGKRVTQNQVRYMTLLHKTTGHLAPSTLLSSFHNSHNLPTWLTKSLLEKFLRSHHCLLCEQYRRRIPHPTGMPSQIPAHSWSYDYIAFRITTIYNMIGFYIFGCSATGAIRVYLVKNKSAQELVICLKDLHVWCGQHGHVMMILRQDSGTTEKL